MSMRFVALFICLLGYMHSPILFGQIYTYVPQKDLVAWFPFTSGVADSSGKANQLTNYNDVKSVSDRRNTTNSARHFNGINQDLKASHSASLSVGGDFTIAAWVLDSLSSSKYQTVLAKRQSGFWNYALTISHDTSISRKGKNKLVTSRRNTGPFVDFKFSLDTIPLNKWIHLAVTVRSDTVRFYVNGKESACLVDSNVLFPKSFGRLFSIPAQDPMGGFSIGSDNDGGDFFKGKIDDVGVWKRCLSSCEIHSLYRSISLINIKPNHGNSFFKCGIDSLTMIAIPGMASYSWSNGVTKVKNTVKKSGIYRLSVKDSIGCNYFDTIKLVFSNPKFSFQGDSLLLRNCKRDSLRVSVGSKWNNTIWSNGKKDSVVFLKNTGIYWVRVLDTNACSAVDTFYFGNAGKVDLVLLSVDSVKCNGGNNGRIVTTLTGGFSPYNLKWDDPSGQTTTTVVNLAVGNYRGIFRDRFGCADTLFVEIKQPSLLYASVAATDSVNCFGGSDGRAFVSVSGGVLPYTYKWNDPLMQVGSLATTLKSGVYSVLVTDAKGCLTNALGNIHQPNKLALSLVKVDSVTCFGTQSGKIEVNTLGGNGVTKYQWNDVYSQNTATADSLGKGIYQVRVSDQYGCKDSAQYSVNQPPLLKLTAVSSDSAKCFNGSSGKLKVSLVGGNGSAVLSWNDSKSQMGTEAINLLAGNYTVRATDRKGCRDSLSMLIKQPTKIIINLVSRDSVNCFAGKDGFLQVSSVGGTGVRNYKWNDPLQQITPKANNLVAGKYVIRVFDSYNCADTQVYEVFEPSQLKLTLDWVDSVDCFNGSDGSFSVNARGGSYGYRFWWKDSISRSSRIAYGLGSKNYRVAVTDYHACRDSFDFLMPQPPRLQLNVAYVDSVNCFQGRDGRIFVDFSGGNGGVRYVWNDPKKQNEDSAVGLSRGSYKVNGLDIYGCKDSIVAFVSEPLKVSIQVSSVDSVSCFKFRDGAIYTTTAGGTGAYDYYWNTTPFQNTSTANKLPAGFYRVWVYDNYGCSDSTGTDVFEPDSITLQITNQIHTMKGERIKLSSVATPIQPYTYNWEPKYIFGSQSSFIEPLVLVPNSGVIKLTITNSKGCPLSDTAFIKVVLPPKEFMPTAFSPNLDSLNEGFGLPLIFETLSFRIYERWGGLVFAADQNSKKWDGMVNGLPAMGGVYYYNFVAKLKGTEQNVVYGGTVTVVR